MLGSADTDVYICYLGDKRPEALHVVNTDGWASGLGRHLFMLGPPGVYLATPFAGGAADTMGSVRSDRRRVLDVTGDQVGNVRKP